MEAIMFYRCELCGTVVNHQDITTGKGCCKCGGLRIKPTNLTLWEKLVQICKHPAVWRWTNGEG